MPLHPETVRQRGYIAGRDDLPFRTVGYDLTVGGIFVPHLGSSARADRDPFAGEIIDEYEIPPQGVVVVFSKETVNLPENVCAYAMPKTSLCAQGILVFNTGIVDPNYQGLLSGTTVNFSQEPYLLKSGDPFLRLVFHELDEPKEATEPTQTSEMAGDAREAYILKNMRRASRFPSTFLNIPGTVKAVSARLVKRERNIMLLSLTLFGGLIAICSAIPILFPKSYYENLDSLAREYSERKDVDEKFSALTKQLDELKRQHTEASEIQSLKDEIDRLKILIGPGIQPTPMRDPVPALPPAASPPPSSRVAPQ